MCYAACCLLRDKRVNLEETILEDDLVRLEPLRDRHAGPLRPLAGDPQIWALTTKRGAGPYFSDWSHAMHHATRMGEQISHAVFDKVTNAWAGHTAFLSIVPEHARIEIGWTWYGAPFRGTHVNPAAKRLLLARAFEAAAERVELKTHHLNTRSQRAMDKLGAVREGVLRSHTECWTGERRGTVYYSILKDEWPGVKSGLDARLSDVSAP